MHAKLKEIIKKSQNIVFFGGAGVSTASGIPDFRSETGLYEQKYPYPPEEILSHAFFMEKTQLFYEFYREKMIYTAALPNACHRVLAKLEADGKLKAVVTQNIDALHQKAGSKNVCELHGSVYRNRCMQCGEKYGIEHILGTSGVPLCQTCGGIVKPDVVLYGEGLDTACVNRAARYISEADVFIVGGTSLTVYPAASLVGLYQGQHLVLINKTVTFADRLAGLVIREDIAAAMDMGEEEV